MGLAEILLGVLLVLTAVLCIWIRPAADDFYYVTFGDGGWQAFLKNNLEHYRTMSGRVFVHFVLYPLLCLDMWPLRAFVAILIGGCSVMAARLAYADRKQRTLAQVIALSAFWLMGIETLQDGVLWGAGTMNYLFPLCLILAYALLMHRVLEGRGGIWLSIPAFFCSCTVEMTGIIACVIFVYLCLTNRKQVQAHRWTILAIGSCTLAGYLFLYTSPGVAVRLEANSAGISLLEKILMNYAMIDRRVIGPEGIWVMSALTLASSGLVLRSQKSGWSVGPLILTGMVVLTGLGVIYDGAAVALIAICAFAALAAFAIRSFIRGERMVPMWMLCITVSLGVCLVSPVMGSRMVMPTAIFMLMICVRNFVQMKLTTRQGLVLAALLTAVACVVLVDHSVHLSRNARIIDDNTRTVEGHKEGTLVLDLVPDERYSGSAVPTVSGFQVHYLRHYGLSGIQCAVRDPSEVDVFWEGKILMQKALLRDGTWYVPIRAAEETIGADISWEMATAAVRTGDQIYCFHLGNRVVNLGHGITGSIKLSGPVRNINGRIYIPVSDFDTLFRVKLTLQDH